MLETANGSGRGKRVELKSAEHLKEGAMAEVREVLASFSSSTMKLGNPEVEWKRVPSV